MKVLWRRWMRRIGVMLTIGLLAGCGGVGELANEARLAEAEIQLEVVANAIDMHRARTRALPSALSELVAKRTLLGTQTSDPWGRPLRYNVKGPQEYVLCSAGPDEASPADDVCHRPK